MSKKGRKSDIESNDSLFGNKKAKHDLDDETIIQKIPEWPEKQRFMRAKGFCNPQDNKLAQYCILGQISQNWLGN